MKFYLAARYSRAPELNVYRQVLETHGHTVTSRWLKGGHELIKEGIGLSPQAADSERRRFALEDWSDLMDAEIVISFTEEPNPNRKRRFPGPGELENWLPVPDSRLQYEVSSFGRVRNGSGETIAGKRSHGYLRVAPNGKNGAGTGIHQLVALVFRGAAPEGCEVDHLDGFKDNNWIGNLEYVTHAENVRRASERMRGGPHAGERNGRAKLTDDDVSEIRARVATGESKASVARDFLVTDVLVGKIARGELWPVGIDSGRGARHVEFGAALATRKPCVVIGPRENVFHHYPGVEHHETWDAFVREWFPGWEA